MKLTAQFNFDKINSTNGASIQTGDGEAFTFNGIARPYRCDKNELLVINSMEVLGDKHGMIADIKVVIDGFYSSLMRSGGASYHGHAVEPDKTLGVQLDIKRASEMHIATPIIDYPVTVTLDVTQYRVVAIES